jgi:preprotein translocase subunit YajC
LNSLRSIFLAVLSVFWGVCAVFAQGEGAPAAAAPQLGPMQRLIAMAPMFLMVFAIFYLLVLLPQRKQLKMQQQLVDGLKKGDPVLTGSGIIARVAGIEKDHILLEVAPGVKVKFERSQVKQRLEKKEG